MPPDHRPAANAAVNATPLVRRLAAQHDVNLAAVHPTGAGGRITKLDVLTAAAASRPAPRPVAAAVPTSRFPSPQPADVTTLAGDPTLLAAARATGPQPTLFASGDLPPMTASGIDPKVLLEVPWQARHSLAAATTTAAAYAIVTDFADLDPESATAWADFSGYAGHRGTQDYITRTEDWLSSADFGSLS